MEKKSHTIQQYLSTNTSLSRRQILDAIKQGLIKVNGQKIDSIKHAILVNQDIVSYRGNMISAEDKFFYYKFNKPRHVISSMSDSKGRVDLRSFLSPLPDSVFPVGRLDRHTTGLLLITNDGDFANRILHPSFCISKSYDLILDKLITKADATRLKAGFFLEDGPVQFDRIYFESKKLINITISIGRNRIVRRAFEFLGYEVKELKRVSIGQILLENLACGDVVSFARKELSLVKQIKETELDN